jgi:hypothetical protein
MELVVFLNTLIILFVRHLGQSLKNLGIAGNGGSLALGKELAITDAVQFMEHVTEFPYAS